MKYKLIIIIAILAIIVLAAWYLFFSPAAPMPYQPTSQQPGGTNISSGDTTKDITNDLNSLPSDSAATQEMNNLDKNLQSF